MTKIDVADRDDLRGDQLLGSRRKDLVLETLANGGDAVLRLEDWLVEEKSLDSIESVDDLFAGRLVYESEKAYLFTTTDEDDPDADAPGTDWVPKSQSRVYLDDTDDGDDIGGNRYNASIADFE